MTTPATAASISTKRRSTAAVAATVASTTIKRAKSPSDRGVWSAEEHDKFLTGIKMYPNGPWKLIAEQVGTRSARQVQTHAQKYYEKVARRLRGLRKHRKKLVRPEHRLGDDMMRMCAVAAPMNAASADVVGVGNIGRGSLDIHLSPLRMAMLPPLTMVACESYEPVDEVKRTIHASQMPSSMSTASPKGVDTISEIKARESELTVKLEEDMAGFMLPVSAAASGDHALPYRSPFSRSFTSLLAGDTLDNFGNFDNIDLDFNVDFEPAFFYSGDAISDCSSDGGSDTASSQGDDTTDSDDVDSLVDLEDRYLDFLMEVLDADMKQDPALKTCSPFTMFGT